MTKQITFSNINFVKFGEFVIWWLFNHAAKSQKHYTVTKFKNISRFTNNYAFVLRNNITLKVFQHRALGGLAFAHIPRAVSVFQFF
jgi:hypothetical protein